MYLNQLSPFDVNCRANSTKVLVLKKTDFLNIRKSYSSELLDILEESANKMITYHEKSKLIKQLLKEYGSIQSMRKKLSQLNVFIFEKNFKSIYEKGVYSITLKQFLKENTLEDIISMLKDKDLVKSKEGVDDNIKQKEKEMKENNPFPHLERNSFYNLNLNNETKRREKKTKDNFTKNDYLKAGVPNSSRKAFSLTEQNINNQKRNDFNLFYRKITSSFGMNRKNEINFRKKGLSRKTMHIFNKNISGGPKNRASCDYYKQGHNILKNTGDLNLLIRKNIKSDSYINKFKLNLSQKKLKYKIEKNVDFVICGYDKEENVKIHNSSLLKTNLTPVFNERFSISNLKFSSSKSNLK
jgi:hypothetical protein